jgi:hypothetical protein
MARWTAVTAELDGDSGAAIRSLARVTAVCKRARVVSITNEALTIEDQWRPFWVVFVAVALFPIGLVALFHRRSGQLVVLTRPASNSTTEVTVTGEASSRLTAMMWRAIGQSLPGTADADPVQRAPLTRWGAVRQICEGWARAHPRTFTVSCGVVVYVVCAALSSWVIWTDVVGNAIFAVLGAGLAARFLRLWPNNRLINWGRATLPAIR